MQRLDAGEPARFVHLILQQDLFEGWILTRESGIQGSRGRAVHQHFVGRQEADEALVNERDRQMKRGYKIVVSSGEVGPA